MTGNKGDISDTNCLEKLNATNGDSHKKEEVIELIFSREKCTIIVHASRCFYRRMKTM